MYQINPLDKYSILEFLEIQEKGADVLCNRWLPKRIALYFAQKEYYKLMDAYLNEIGLPQNYLSYLHWQQEYASCMYEVMNGQIDMKVNALFALNMAEKALPQSDNNTHIEETAIVLSKHLGFKIDLKNTTIRQFYSMIKQYGN